MGWRDSLNGEDGNTYKILVGKPCGKQKYGQVKGRWEDNIKMDLGKISC
jgi:hypothetical protein